MNYTYNNPNSQLQEEIGREYLTNFLSSCGINEIYYTEDQYNPVDAYTYTATGEKAAIEIKVRDTKYMSYSDHILQKDKYDNMKSSMSLYNIPNGFYANFFGSNMLYIYDISIIEGLGIEPEASEYRINNYTQNTKTKYVYKLPSKYAYKFIKIGNEWKVFS